MCDRCGDPNHTEAPKQGGSYQTLGLKAHSQYETPYMTQRAFVGSSAALVASVASGDVSIIPIVIQGINPRHLHQQPGASVNAYALIKDIAVNVRVNAPGITIPSFLGGLFYRDAGGADHFLGALDMTKASATVVNFVALNSTTIVIPPAPFTSAMPTDLGKLVLVGAFGIGTAASVTFDIYCNVGFLYGVPR